MSDPTAGPRAQSAPELKAQIEAEREGLPFLVYRDGADRQVILLIEDERTELWVGRREPAEIRLDFDEEVSGLHAQLEFVGRNGTLVDDGLSRNGSYVNGERVRGRRLLRDGDVMRFGRSHVLFRAPQAESAEATAISADLLEAGGVSPAQRRVLIALCRPYKDGAAFATPASNSQIGDELHLSVDAVKTHLRALFEKFGVGDLPQNQKRVALVQRALQTGMVNERDL
ncbi:MAG TPA: FHA domain-containing protein [Solirubrobacterales bacterium]|nr:FHA domain-containing protein [Solirubrobacterales bacterium]